MAWSLILLESSFYDIGASSPSTFAAFDASHSCSYHLGFQMLLWAGGLASSCLFSAVALRQCVSSFPLRGLD